MNQGTVWRWINVAWLTGLMFAAAPALADEPAVGESGLRFSHDVQPILAANCLECHGPDRQRGNIGFHSAPLALAVGESGEPAIVPGDADASALIRRVTSDDNDYRMPPSGEPLTDEEIDVLRQWISAGAEFEPHWAFQQPQRPNLPEVRDADWPRNEIDHFILAQLEDAGFTPADEADPYTLVRRLYLDLIGLPPTPAQADAFVENESPDAYEQLVDELLVSPHFGERWGRHWLDLARYADSDGYERDYWRPGAWRYRDYVIDAVNDDLPYDQFIIEQIAGDLLPDATQSQRIATGFHRNELLNTEGGIDVEQARWDRAVGQTNAVGTAMMGVTLACAQCHTHKYDPVTHDEYHGMLAFFWGQMEERDIPADAMDDPANRGDPIHVGARPDDQVEDYVDRDLIHVVMNREERRPTHLRERGDFQSPAHEVSPHVPEVLGELEPRDPETEPDRLDLARWIAGDEHPLTARVAVNQFWAKLMGIGIVSTKDDFGLQGERPTHPDLLDWLAIEFMESGWSRKHIVRQVVLSSAYRQASAHRSELAASDPQNRLYGRQDPRRVEAEVVRDYALYASGLLVTEVGGPSFRDRIPQEMRRLGWGQTWEAHEPPQVYRRAVYMAYRRNTPVPMMPVFDQPDAAMACTDRDVSASPLQTLTLWNAPIFLESAQALGVTAAEKTRDGAEAEDVAHWLWRQNLVRPATEQELTVLRDVHAGFADEYAADPEQGAALMEEAPVELEGVDPATAAAWTATARMLLGLDQTITRE